MIKNTHGAFSTSFLRFSVTALLQLPTTNEKLMPLSWIGAVSSVVYIICKDTVFLAKMWGGVVGFLYLLKNCYSLDLDNMWNNNV